MKEILSYLKRNKIKSLFHATYRPALSSIKKHGLGASPEERINAWEGLSENYVYLSADQEQAISFAECAENDNLTQDWLDQIIVLEIEVSDLDLDLLSFDENNKMEEPFKSFQYKGIIKKENFTVRSDD